MIFVSKSIYHSKATGCPGDSTVRIALLFCGSWVETLLREKAGGLLHTQSSRMFSRKLMKHYQTKRKEFQEFREE